MKTIKILGLLASLSFVLISCNSNSQTIDNKQIKEAITQPDEIRGDCKKAKETGTIEAYNAFIKKYPKSEFTDTILKLRNELDTVKPDLKFKQTQLKWENAKLAYSEKEPLVKELLKSKEIDYETLETFIRVIKSEQILEIWAKDRKNNLTYQLIKTYNLCVTKNTDKLRGIDLLVPESFYYIANFYPFSPYMLRLEINFPNESDKKRGRSGGDIAIHGGCFSTYCTPFTDEDIKEIYIFAVEAKAKGISQVPVHNYPYRMTEENFKKYSSDPKYKDDAKRIALWENMKENYQYFEQHKQLQAFTVDSKGKYIYKKN